MVQLSFQKRKHSIGGLVAMPCERSISGHALRGRKIVRFLYLDDAGLSRIADEPYLLVAGALIDADNVWRDVNAHFRAIVENLWPEPDLPMYNFCFQAKHIYHGSGKFPRADWTIRQRMNLLKRLLSIYRLHSIPIVYGAIDRAAHRKRKLEMAPNITDGRILEDAYAIAFTICVQKADRWLERHTNNEAAKIVVEDNRQMRQVVNMIHDGYSNPDYDMGDDVFVSNRFLDGVSFETKKDSKLLQIADHVAFVIKRRLQGDPHIAEAFDLISPYIVAFPNSDLRDISIKVHHQNIELLKEG